MATKSTSRPRPKPERIALAREMSGLTQEELAASIGCSVFAIGKWERGERNPSGKFLRKLARRTGKPIPWFYGEEGAPA